MTRKQIDQSREARLWFSQVIVPVAMAAAVVMSNPESKAFVTDKVDKCKSAVNTRFNKIKKKFKKES